MRLRMDLDGIILQLKIKEYRPADGNDWDDKWCKVDFSFSSGDWLNYHKENDEVLLSCEVEEIAGLLRELLDNKLTEPREKSCIEPDFHFVLHPIYNLRDDPQYVYVRKGYELVDISLKWVVSFWNGGLTDNYLSVTLNRNDIEILLTYFRYILGEISEDSQEISNLINQGYLTD